MKFMYFSIKFPYSDILLKKTTETSFLTVCFCCNHTCNCVGMVSVTSASHNVTSA